MATHPKTSDTAQRRQLQRQQYIELPENLRATRPVPCRQCVRAMLRAGPRNNTRCAANANRGGRVACTTMLGECFLLMVLLWQQTEGHLEGLFNTSRKHVPE
jgi:hypothetical protein